MMAYRNETDETMLSWTIVFSPELPGTKSVSWIGTITNKSFMMRTFWFSSLLNVFYYMYMCEDDQESLKLSYYANLRAAVAFPKMLAGDFFNSPKLTTIGITFFVSRKFELKNTPVCHHTLI